MKKIRFGVAVLFVFLLAGTGLRAEENEDSKENSMYLNEVVVTSTRTENRIMETPSNISVITADDLKAMDAKNVAEAIKNLPGISYTNASGLEAKVSLRATRVGMSAAALVLINGIPVNLGKFGYVDWESLPVENIERIEVIKGPMSALYGGESSRGVINITTRRGKQSFGGEVGIIAGDDNDRRASALIYGSSGKWDYNFNVKKREEDGYRDETKIDNYYVNGEAGYWLSDETRIGFYANFTDKDRVVAKDLSAEERAQNPKQSPDLSDTENTDVITGLNLDIRKSLFDLDTTLYYKNRDKHYENYLKAEAGTPYQEDLDEDVYGTRAIFTLKQPVFGRKNRLSAGFDYDRDETDLETVKAAKKIAGAAYTEADPKKSGDFTREELGIFLQNEFSILENLTLTAGLRYDYFAFENNADYDFSRNGKYDYDDRPEYDNWNPRISLSYSPLDSLSFYGSYSRSYRAPTIYDYYASGSYSAQNAYTLEPETFTQYETGFRYALSKWLNVDASVFRIVVDDMLDTAYDADGTYMGKQNISQGTMKGFELSLSGKPSERFSYRISYSYTDARYSDDFYAKADTDTVVNINGNRMTKTPYNTLNVDLDALLCEWQAYRLLWHMNVYGQDGYAMDNADDPEYAGYALVNTKLRLEHRSFEVFAAVDNLLDKDYDGYAYSSYGSQYYYPADGIGCSFGVTYKF